MNSRVEIVPAIMPKNLAELEEKLRAVALYADFVQIDIMDGKFVPGTTWPYAEGDSIELPHTDDALFEIDLMIEKPEEVIDEWVSAGAKRIVVHIESTDALDALIRGLELSDVSLGIALNTTTFVEKLEPYLEKIDFVQCMGIGEIGKQGEPFDERVFGQLRALRARKPDLALSVDGGVRLVNARALVEAGANRLVSGSEILTSADIGETVKKFHAIVEGEDHG